MLAIYQADFAHGGFTALHYCACGGQEPALERNLIGDMLSAAPDPTTALVCARLLVDIGKLSAAQIDTRDEREEALPASGTL